MKVFLNTNVLLDVLGRPAPFYEDSAAVWTLVETGSIQGALANLSLVNLFYLLRKPLGLKAAKSAIAHIRGIFQLVPLDAEIVDHALKAEIADFEDAMQYFSARRTAAAALITRNVSDFPTRDLVVQTPAQFLATFPSP